MKRAMLVLAIAAAVAAPWAFSRDEKNLSQVTLPDERAAASKALHEWLTARGIDSEHRSVNTMVILKRSGVPVNITPYVQKGELDRLRAVSFYSAKDEFKGKPEMLQLAVKLNKTQNFCQVSLDDDGHLIVASNMTFFDEFSAREFDAFMDLFVGVIKQYILTPEAVKMLS